MKKNDLSSFWWSFYEESNVQKGVEKLWCWRFLAEWQLGRPVMVNNAELFALCNAGDTFSKYSNPVENNFH